MQRIAFMCFTAAMWTAAATGCATTGSSSPQAAVAEPNTKLAEAPLGSRIRRSSALAPTSGVSRQEIEQNKAQTGIVRAGIVNDGGR